MLKITEKLRDDLVSELEFLSHFIGGFHQGVIEKLQTELNDAGKNE